MPDDWGGRRPGAGRKPKGAVAMVSHKKRPEHSARFPLYVVLRLRPEVAPLRRAVVQDALQAGSDRFGFRLVQVSIDGLQLHLIVEAKDRLALIRGMHGLTIRIARTVNRVSGRRGHVFADHYEARELRTAEEVREVLEKHGGGAPIAEARTRFLR